MASGDVTRVRHYRYVRSIPVKANAVIRKNDLVLTQDADGFAIPGAVVASCKGIGIAIEDVDNTGGASGAKTIDVEQGVFLLSNHGTNTVAAVDVAKMNNCFAEGVEAVGNDSVNKSPVGKVVGLGWQNLSGVQVEIKS